MTIKLHIKPKVYKVYSVIAKFRVHITAFFFLENRMVFNFRVYQIFHQGHNFLSILLHENVTVM
jgi:hypothetical protein